MTRFPSKVLVAGATGGTGRRVVARLHQLGVSARVLTRNRRRALRFGAVEVVEGNALAMGDCARAVKGCDGVVCALGERWIPRGRPVVDGAGVIHLADAAGAAGVRRFVLVSSIGVGETWDWLPGVMKAFFRSFGLVAILEEKGRAEAHLKSLALDWTILYPGLLTNFRMRAEPLLINMGIAGGTTTRQAVADVAVRCLGSPGSIGTVLTIVDRCWRFTASGQEPFSLDVPWERWSAGTRDRDEATR